MQADTKAKRQARPVSPDWRRYERLKRQFRDDRPDATPAEYEAAMCEFARMCGV